MIDSESVVDVSWIISAQGSGLAAPRLSRRGIDSCLRLQCHVPGTGIGMAAEREEHDLHHDVFAQPVLQASSFMTVLPDQSEQNKTAIESE
jgi:hypothetical protein